MSFKRIRLDVSIWPSDSSSNIRPPSRADIAELSGMVGSVEVDSVSSISWDRSDGLMSSEGGIALSFLAALAGRIGLLTGVAPQLEQPYNAARRIAALDHASAGRAGWGIAADPASHARDREFISVARALWDSWEDGAAVFDRATDRVLAPRSVRYTAHRDSHFRVRGPLNVSRPPAGAPPAARRNRRAR